jgi:cell wall assembly regulator SMI1
MGRTGNMFLEKFIRARDNLIDRGFKPALTMGSPVSERDLDALDAKTNFSLPPELRQFYLEMGDAFGFEPDTRNSPAHAGWEPGWEVMRLADHKIHNIGFVSAIQEEAATALGRKNSRTPPELLKQEVERRKRWMPFYGFGGNGNCLCLDLAENPPTVRFYDSITWTNLPQAFDFILASSFTEFVERWGHYNFLAPKRVWWTSFCDDCSGRFDWAPGHFSRINDEDAKLLR